MTILLLTATPLYSEGVRLMGLNDITKDFLSSMERRYGRTERVAKGFVLNFGEQITCSIRYSKVYKKGASESAFFAVEQDFVDGKFKEGTKSPLGIFGVFLWGDKNHALVVPQTLFAENLKSAPTNRIHIDKREEQFFLRVSGHTPIDITDYLNNFPPSISEQADKPPLTVEPVENQEQSIREHLRIQYFLIKFGRAAGYTVWVAPQDRNLEYEGERFSDLALRNLPNFGFDSNTNTIIQNIDVLWLEGNIIHKAFEIESTTSIYSGLLRLSDLVLAQPNTTIDLNVVAPLSRRENVKRNILRPTFQSLRRKCSYISFEEVTKKYQLAKEIIKLQAQLKLSLESEKF